MSTILRLCHVPTIGACIFAVLLSPLAIAADGASSPATASKPTKSVPSPGTVVLNSDGELTAVVVDDQGRRLIAKPVVIRFQGRPIVTTKSDDTGTVRIVGLRTGLHEITVANTKSAYRFQRATGDERRGNLLVVSNGRMVVRGIDPPDIDWENAFYSFGFGLFGGLIGYGLANENDDPASP